MHPWKVARIVSRKQDQKRGASSSSDVRHSLVSGPISAVHPRSQKQDQKVADNPPPLSLSSDPISAIQLQRRIQHPVYQHLMGQVSQLTRRAYAQDLGIFAQWWGEPRPQDAVNRFLALSGPEANLVALRWLESMSESNAAPATQSRRMSALKSAVRIARVIGLVSWQIEVKPPRAQKFRDTRGISPDDVRKMLDLCADNTKGKRNRAILWLLFTLGLRRSEISSLRIGDYDKPGRRLFIHGKGGERDPKNNQWRTISIDTAQVLDDWLNTYKRDNSARIFIGWRNKKPTQSLNSASIWRIVNRLGKQVGVRAWPHSFRHASATTALKQGETLVNVQRFMRHTDPKTTMIYNDDVTDAPGKVSELLSKVLKPS